MFVRILVTGVCLLMAVSPARAQDARFDHTYTDYATLLSRYVAGTRVDYAALKAGRIDLDRLVDALASVPAPDLASWTRDQQLAFWINAYNVLTLRAVVDHYPIRGSWLRPYPRNSIRQIDGVWTTLSWRVADRTVTLDDIEHVILRPQFGEPRVHVAINCASIGCPPLATEPYRAAVIEQQLDAATRRYLDSPLGLRVDGNTLRLSSIFKWFGSDFDARYAAEGPEGRSPTDRALLALVRRYGPPVAQRVAQDDRVRIAFLSYDWSLNDDPIQSR